MTIIWPQYRIQDLFGEPKEIEWGKGQLANLVYIKTQDGKWFEGTGSEGGLDKDSKTWNVEVWMNRSTEFVEAFKRHNETES